jgi:hypothetical protein
MPRNGGATESTEATEKGIKKNAAAQTLSIMNCEMGGFFFGRASVLRTVRDLLLVQIL